MAADRQGLIAPAHQAIQPLLLLLGGHQIRLTQHRDHLSAGGFGAQ